jgi:hypothetical protein
MALMKEEIKLLGSQGYLHEKDINEYLTRLGAHQNKHTVGSALALTFEDIKKEVEKLQTWFNAWCTIIVAEPVPTV